MQNLLKNKLMLAVLVVGVAGAGWYFFLSSPATPDLSAESRATVSVDQGIVSALLSLRAVELNPSIFSNPAFKELNDLSIDIVSEPVGRTNPFAPYSTQTGTSTSR